MEPCYEECNLRGGGSVKSALLGTQECHPCERSVSKASLTAMLTKGCGEDNDEDCSHADKAPSDGCGTAKTSSHSGYCYMEVLSKRG